MRIDRHFLKPLLEVWLCYFQNPQCIAPFGLGANSAKLTKLIKSGQISRSSLNTLSNPHLSQIQYKYHILQISILCNLASIKRRKSIVYPSFRLHFDDKLSLSCSDDVQYNITVSHDNQKSEQHADKIKIIHMLPPYVVFNREVSKSPSRLKYVAGPTLTVSRLGLIHFTTSLLSVTVKNCDYHDIITLSKGKELRLLWRHHCYSHFRVWDCYDVITVIVTIGFGTVMTSLLSATTRIGIDIKSLLPVTVKDLDWMTS